MNSDPGLESDRLLSFPAVHRLTSASRASIWRWEREGRFPPRRRIGKNRVGWVASEVMAWIEDCPKGMAGAPVSTSSATPDRRKR